MAQIAAKPARSNKSAASSSVFTFVGHKEDMVAKMMSEELAKDLAEIRWLWQGYIGIILVTLKSK